MKIITSHDYPPIPTRDHDWSAVTDNYDWAPDSKDCPRGYGATEIEAINDLVEQLVEEAYANGWDDATREMMVKRQETHEDRLQHIRDDMQRAAE